MESGMGRFTPIQVKFAMNIDRSFIQHISFICLVAVRHTMFTHPNGPVVSFRFPFEQPQEGSLEKGQTHTHIHTSPSQGPDSARPAWRP